MFTKHCNILILSIALMSSLVFVYFVFLGKDKDAVVNVAETTSPIQSCTDNKHQDNGKHVITSESSSTIPHSKPNDVTSTNDLHLTVLNLWYDLASHDEDIPVRLDPRIKQAKKIGFNSRLMAILEKDDRVQLPLIDDQRYLLQIKNINKNSNNDIEIYGELNHNGKIYASTVSLTTKKVLLALLSTPSGHFDVRMANDKGYIYQSDQLEDIEAMIDLPRFLYQSNPLEDIEAMVDLPSFSN